ncbi:hypothetical protein MKY15_21725 [Sporosarcina sp. FSL K6-1540]|uniref:hypothetical protein n=1 Tax=Sporosarcina sp. FSL K6-1540 TaxID=2921555 RepID=UPI00315B0DE6
MLIALMSVLYGCSDSNLASNGYELITGTTGEKGITEVTDEFTLGQEIAFEIERRRIFF